MDILYKPSFVKEYDKLPPALKEEVREKIALFKNPKNHKHLKVHKLKGKLKQFYSFSVSYQHRIVFAYESKQSVVLIAIGDHAVYE